MQASPPGAWTSRSLQINNSDDLVLEHLLYNFIQDIFQLLFTVINQRQTLCLEILVKVVAVVDGPRAEELGGQRFAWCEGIATAGHGQGHDNNGKQDRRLGTELNHFFDIEFAFWWKYEIDDFLAI